MTGGRSWESHRQLSVWASVLEGKSCVIPGSRVLEEDMPQANRTMACTSKRSEKTKRRREVVAGSQAPGD